MIPMPLSDVAAAVNAPCTSSYGRVFVHHVTTDSREVEPGHLFFAIRGERLDGHQFITQAAIQGAVACVVDRKWSEAADRPEQIPCLEVDDTVAALGRLAEYYRREVMAGHTVVVAVTGSNGKTTTKCMLDHVLRPTLQGRAAPKSYNNQIGVPLTLLSAEMDDRYLIVEIGTNASGEVAALAATASPDIGVITSIGEAHLEGLRSVDAIAAEKVSLLDHLRGDGLGVVNVDRPEIRPHLSAAHLLRDARPGSSSHSCVPRLMEPRDTRPRFPCGLKPAARAVRVITFGFDASAQRRVALKHESIRRTAFELDGKHRIELRMPGSHHAANAVATFIVAQWFGLAAEEIIERLRRFAPPPGRARVLECGQVTVVDDSYNANPASTAAAVESLRREESRRRVFVLGDMLELGSDSPSYHRRVVQAIVDAGIELLVAVGEAATEATRAVVEAVSVPPGVGEPPLQKWGTPGGGAHDTPGGGTQVILCDAADAASEALTALLRPGDLIWIKGSRAMELDRVIGRIQNAQ